MIALHIQDTDGEKDQHWLSGEGINDWSKFIWHIGIPLIKPMIVALSLISIVYHWNEFFWPMLVTNTAKARTLTIGLAMFGLKGETGAEWALTMAITIVVILPLVLIFGVFRRQFINSFMQSGTTG